MTKEPQSIEVEVVEIDGAAAPVKFQPREEAQQTQRQWQDWQQWQGRVRKLDSRWWPLWVFLGSIAVLLLLTFGVVIGAIFVIFRILSGIVRGIFR